MCKGLEVHEKGEAARLQCLRRLEWRQEPGLMGLYGCAKDLF